jgi:mono/diheme cytochrome c family protein
MSRTSRIFALALTVALALAAGGCTRDMKDQPKVKTFAASTFYDDGAASRPLPPGTVPRGFLREDKRLYAGLDENGKFVTQIPVTVDTALLQRGHQRFDIFCSPCHGRVGDGRGMIVQRGFKQPPTYHSDRLRGVRDGYIFDVITNGFGQMSSYASQVPPRDRWAIVAYVRALQLSQYVDTAKLPQPERTQIEREITASQQASQPQQEEGHGEAGH